MKQPSHLHRDLVEATVRRVLAGVRTDPERELRKLVDLGADVSRGRFQRRFLTAAQHLLEDPDSSYYAIARELLSRADFDRLVAFGMALGYDGCTRGARLIRQIEAEHGFNIPWALSLETESARLSGGELDRWTALIAEGTRLGIHAYLLRCDDPAAAVPLAARQKNCAFLLFVRPDETGPRLLAALGKAPTCAVSVELAPGAQAACAALRQAGILHGGPLDLRRPSGDPQRLLGRGRPAHRSPLWDPDPRPLPGRDAAGGLPVGVRPPGGTAPPLRPDRTPAGPAGHRPGGLG